MKKILIVSGGTGGHVFPALALAALAQEKGYAIEWLGTQKGIERSLVQAAEYPFYAVELMGLRGKNMRQGLKALAALLRALWTTLLFIRQRRPDLVVCFGGFSSVPGGIAAFLLRIPLIIHEQNALEGWANRLLAPCASRIAMAFPRAFSRSISFIRSKCVVTGNPVRASLSPPGHEVLQAGTLTQMRFLILGGSLGAHSLNRVLPFLLSKLSIAYPQISFSVLHQTGAREQQDTQKRYTQHGFASKHLDIKSFIEDMASAYAEADCVIARAGALTIAEIAMMKLPSILIPYPAAVDDHQRKNAEYLESVGGAWMVIEKGRPEKIWAEELWVLLKKMVEDSLYHPEKIEEMRRIVGTMAHPHATERLLDCCEHYL